VTLVSPRQAIEDVARLLRHDPRARTVNIEEKHAPSVPGVMAKEDHLIQVLLNLGINALDAMPSGGTLTFETSVDEGMVTVRVRDTGGGVPQEAEPHLFDPFFSTKEPGMGTGLGLFVSKSIVEGLGGRLELERSRSKGSVFSIRLPPGADNERGAG